MDWVIDVEIQFAVHGDASTGEVRDSADEARSYLKALLEVLIHNEKIKHYHILTQPRLVDS